MRVLFTTYEFPARGQSFVENYVLALTERGTDVCVVSSAPGDHTLDVDVGGPGSGRGSLTVIRASRRDTGARKALTLLRTSGAAGLRQRSELRALVGAARRQHGVGREFLRRLFPITPILSWPADVVHLGWLTAATEWIELLPALDVPIVVSCRGSDLRIDPLLDDGYRRRIAVVFDRADAVHCVSEELAGQAVAFGADTSKVFVRPWGVDTTFFSPSTPRTTPLAPVPSGRALRVVTVARLHWVKGHEYALAALDQVRGSGLDVEYTIIGDAHATGRASVLTAIRDLGLEDRVVVRDVIDRVEVRDALRSADVFLLSSVSEGLSNATLEAMAVGLPVVVTDVGGMREIVTDGDNGLVVPPRDPAALAAALRDLAADSELREKMGERGRLRVVDDFEVGVCTDAMLEQYRRLVGASRA